MLKVIRAICDFEVNFEFYLKFRWFWHPHGDFGDARVMETTFVDVKNLFHFGLRRLTAKSSRKRVRPHLPPASVPKEDQFTCTATL
jgi:hypothetical protein